MLVERGPLRALLVALSVAWVLSGAAEAQIGVAGGQRHFHLSARTSKEALLVLRAVGSLRGVSAVDDDTVQVEGSYEDLELAESVLWLFDVDTGADPRAARVPIAADGTVLARFAVDALSPYEVVRKLRSELGVRFLALAEEPNVVLLRDNQERVEAAERQVRLLLEEGGRQP